MVDPMGGQKTGFFLDQRLNRAAVAAFAKGARVLDLHTNAGGFALHAALAGAAEVVGVDSSEEAIASATANAALNGVSATFLKEEAEVALERYAKEGRTFDVIILDPPPLARSRAHVGAARRKLVALNGAALAILSPGGILATATCSHHIDRDAFDQALREAAGRARNPFLILERRGASPDHPVLAAMPETEYLKMVIGRG
jgi:23S rRNA (cytosine1962-C5)-methyltransferase